MTLFSQFFKTNHLIPCYNTFIPIKGGIGLNLLTLKHELNNFVNGLSLIESSVFCFANEDEMNLIKKIFNGKTMDGLTKKRYLACFQYSFEDEVSEVREFAYQFAEDDVIKEKIDSDCYTNDGKNILSLILGFELAITSLQNIVTICSKDVALKEHLTNYAYDEEKHCDSFENLFANKGLTDFKENFALLQKAFLNELKEEVGQEKIEAIEKEAQALLDAA